MPRSAPQEAVLAWPEGHILEDPTVEEHAVPDMQFYAVLSANQLPTLLQQQLLGRMASFVVKGYVGSTFACCSSVSSRVLHLLPDLDSPIMLTLELHPFLEWWTNRDMLTNGRPFWNNPLQATITTDDENRVGGNLERPCSAECLVPH